MKSKRWLCVFFLLFFAGMGGYMAINYHFDPLGYFTVQKEEPYYRSNIYTRAIKSEYVTKNADNYDAVIIGGSKSGVLSTKLLSQYTGKRYYNFYFNKGNFSDYLAYSRYLVEHTNISEITLHLSGFEVNAYKPGSGTVLQIPALVSGNSWNRLTEYCSFLLTDLNTLRENINKGTDDSLLDDITNGERNRLRSYKKMLADPEKYILRNVTVNFNKHLKKMFQQKKASSAPAYEDNLNALRQIKTLCEENNVTLNVVIGAGFIGERDSYEGDRYYAYLNELVTITDVWDFSDFNDINMNPYNFVNRKHYNNNVADLMVNTMYGQYSYEGFGIYLTKDNINDYLKERKTKFEQLKEEFETTGTVALQGMEDGSYLPVSIE